LIHGIFGWLDVLRKASGGLSYRIISSSVVVLFTVPAIIIIDAVAVIVIVGMFMFTTITRLGIIVIAIATAAAIR
jgi:hypothetical protein